ncbi:MAG: hypothetical protein A2W31_14100 [Planctomycetes bacterium RBG_16_64_10]|nr:MAG: hypothetical protein A2W31_14100 [Planctomycetes bacterium RBG_16_64_10]
MALVTTLSMSLLVGFGPASATELKEQEHVVRDPSPASPVAAPGLFLADHGVSAYRNAISQSASPSEQRAATELQTFLEQICGARLLIIRDDQPLGEHEIILGDNAHLPAVGVDIDFASLGDEGFVLRVVAPHLVIAGSRVRGTLYGVYALLEEHLGCRWFTPTVSHIPRVQRLHVNAINDRQVPQLEYREVFFVTARDGDWAARNRLNSSMAHLTDEHGGRINYYPFVHSFFTLIPPDPYFHSHPEWFSLVDGQRTLVGRYKRTQLCLTNEQMIQQAIKTVQQWIHDHPEARIISVSQNDGPGGWCECDHCVALEQREGGAHSAPIIHFVNRIAAAIADQHPNVAIDTLAYSYSRQAPKTLKPRPNVIIRLTTGACCSHTIADEKCADNADLRGAIRDWFRLTDRIYVWDYVVNFRQYLLPFPNLGTLGPNLRFLVDHGVRGIFEQGSGDVLDSDMAPLKAYLLAKLLCNPDCDVRRVVREFLAAYYGAAAEPIGAYLDLLQREVEGDDYRRLHMSPFEPSIEAPYLTPDVLANAMRLFDEAERLVADDPDRLLRVQTARLGLDYVKVALAARLKALLDADAQRLPWDSWYQRATDAFFATAQRAGITHMREAGRPQSSMADFRLHLGLGPCGSKPTQGAAESD